MSEIKNNIPKSYFINVLPDDYAEGISKTEVRAKAQNMDYALNPQAYPNSYATQVFSKEVTITNLLLSFLDVIHPDFVYLSDEISPLTIEGFNNLVDGSSVKTRDDVKYRQVDENFIFENDNYIIGLSKHECEEASVWNLRFYKK